MPPSFLDTARWALRYLPPNAKVKDGPAGIQALAEDVDEALTFPALSVQLSDDASIPAASLSSPTALDLLNTVMTRNNGDALVAAPVQPSGWPLITGIKTLKAGLVLWIAQATWNTGSPPSGVACRLPIYNVVGSTAQLEVDNIAPPVDGFTQTFAGLTLVSANSTHFLAASTNHSSGMTVKFGATLTALFLGPPSS